MVPVPENPPDAVRVGVCFPNAMGTRHLVEANMRPIGYTSHDVRVGCHVYWFKSLAEFKENARAVFEQFGNGINPPVPIILTIPQGEQDFAALKVEADKAPDAEFLRVVADWAKVRETHYDELHDAAVEQLEDEFNNVRSGLEAAKVGEPLPKDANQWLQFGFNRYKPDPVATTTTTSTTSTPPPIQTDEMRALADKIAGVVGERSIRLKDLAAELGATPEDIRPLIEADPRFAPIPSAQWVKLKPKD